MCSKNRDGKTSQYVKCRVRRFYKHPNVFWSSSFWIFDFFVFWLIANCMEIMDMARNARVSGWSLKERVGVLFFSGMCGSVWGPPRRLWGPYLISRPGLPCRMSHVHLNDTKPIFFDFVECSEMKTLIQIHWYSAMESKRVTNFSVTWWPLYSVPGDWGEAGDGDGDEGVHDDVEDVEGGSRVPPSQPWSAYIPDEYLISVTDRLCQTLCFSSL